MNYLKNIFLNFLIVRANIFLKVLDTVVKEFLKTDTR